MPYLFIKFSNQDKINIQTFHHNFFLSTSFFQQTVLKTMEKLKTVNEVTSPQEIFDIREERDCFVHFNHDSKISLFCTHKKDRDLTCVIHPSVRNIDEFVSELKNLFDVHELEFFTFDNAGTTPMSERDFLFLMKLGFYTNENVLEVKELSKTRISVVAKNDNFHCIVSIQNKKKFQREFGDKYQNNDPGSDDKASTQIGEESLMVYPGRPLPVAFGDQDDNEWNIFHDKIREERQRKNLTIHQFLHLCKLHPERPYFQQLSSMIRLSPPPSKRRNTPGREFRDAVALYFTESFQATEELPPQPLETLIDDWSLDHAITLRDMHISKIYATHDSTGCIYEVSSFVLVLTSILRFESIFDKKMQSYQ
jgi:hypothetical protein